MPHQYKYRGVTSGGQTREGVIAAAGEPAVLEYLAEQEITPVVVEAVRREHSLSLWVSSAATSMSCCWLSPATCGLCIGQGFPSLRALSASNLVRLKAGSTLRWNRSPQRSVRPHTLAGSMAEFETSSRRSTV